MFRLTLDCGHIAYALTGEEHRRGRHRECHACAGHERIVESTPFGRKR